MRILDATCGARSIWYQKTHPLVTFMDIRQGTITTLRPGNKLRCKRNVVIEPDVVADFRDTPFEDECFDVVVFDPPHILRRVGSKPSIMDDKYGSLTREGYRGLIRDGTEELFRVLKPEGIFIFKWSETDINVCDVLKLFPYKPLFGTRTGQRNNTHWILFLKERRDLQIGSFRRGAP